MAIVAVSVAVRVATSLALQDQWEGLPGTADQISYHTIAQRLLDGKGFSFESAWWPATAAGAATAHWSFLYTYFLAAVYAIFGPNPLAARLIQSLAVGILHPLLAYLLGRRMFGNTAGLAAAGITAIYAYFIYYSATLMTEPFYITAVLASLYLTIQLVDRSKSEGAASSEVRGKAAALGLAVLLRQVFLLFVPILLIWAWWASARRLGWTALLPGLVVAGMVLPFAIYNSNRSDSFVLLNTNAGYALFWANHPIYGTQFEPILPDEMGSYQDLIPEELRELDEAALDRELLQLGIGFVADDPVRYVQLSISRIPAYFMFWPSGDSGMISNVARVLSFGLFLPFMLFGLAKVWIDHGMTAIWEPVGLLTLFVVAYSAIHLLSWSMIRYRLPVDAVLVIFAGFAVVELSRRISKSINLPVAQPA